MTIIVSNNIQNSEFNCATTIIRISFNSILKLKYILFFKSAFIKVARTTKPFHYPVYLLCQSRLRHTWSLKYIKFIVMMIYNILMSYNTLIISCVGCNPQLQCSRVIYLYANHKPPFSLLCLCIWVVYTNNCDSYNLKRSRSDMPCDVM